MSIKYKVDFKSVILVTSIFFNIFLLAQFMIVQAKEEVIVVALPTVEIEQGLTTEASVIVKDVEIVELTEREKINIYVTEISTLYNMDPELIHSVIWHESRYKPEAKNYNGTCLGLMQVCPRWHRARAERLGVTDFNDSYGSILLGVDYLSELYSRHKDIELTLMLYNMTHKSAFSLHTKGETNNYTKSVLKRAQETIQGVK